MMSTIRSSSLFITWQWLKTLHEVLHELQTIKMHFYDCNSEIIFFSDEVCAKMPQKPSYE